jgi:hypothetical protein
MQENRREMATTGDRTIERQNIRDRVYVPRRKPTILCETLIELDDRTCS